VGPDGSSLPAPKLLLLFAALALTDGLGVPADADDGAADRFARAIQAAEIARLKGLGAIASVSGRHGYATWNDRLARPYQNPSTVKSGAGAGSRAAPSVTNSGAKWSMVGWA
jgi:hypothetical protein